ncbi:MAG: ATP-dependent Clp protease proteolytic subunit [Bacteroidales bacterium]|jgi:ATP-dependent protease ClpP protease subunit|nr:ATP-dependent Clp protease proteolytic subunit [Bacteroidales bacterium]
MNFQIKIEGVFGVDFTADDIIEKMVEAEGSPIDFFFNSPGGELPTAERLIEAMELYQGQIAGHIAPFAASAASYMLTACGMVYSYPDSVWMCHNASQLVYGPASLHRQQADHLDDVDIRLAERYAAFSGKNMMDVIAMMEAETWLEGEDIQIEGFSTIYDDTGDQPAYPAAGIAKQEFASMAAAYVKISPDDPKRVASLKLWRSRNPDNLQIKELVNNAIAAGKSEKDIMAKLLVCERDAGGRLTLEEQKACKAFGITAAQYNAQKLKG